MIRNILLLIVGLVSLAVIMPSHVYAGIAKVSVIVVDEDGKPVESAKVKIGFTSTTGTDGETDGDGRYSATAFSDDGIVVGTVNKEAFYESVFSKMFTRKKLGAWQPWDYEFKVTLRPILNPVPMYVRDRWIKIPAVGKEIGFDLEKFDWAIPYGLGTHSDFIFKLDRRYENIDEFEVVLTLTFSNPNDGIQVFKDDLGGIYGAGSWYRFLRTAPKDGYVSKVIKRRTHGTAGWHNDYAKDNNYLFRVRSEVDEEGYLKRAMYGKIRGDISFDPRGTNTAEIHFLYYLNPDYTCNLEFDPKKNLFSPLPNGETSVKLP